MCGKLKSEFRALLLVSGGQELDTNRAGEWGGGGGGVLVQRLAHGGKMEQVRGSSPGAG
jgi:hypothetical protein